MGRLINPAAALMNRLRYPQKFLLISLLFVAPLALVMALLIGEINSEKNFTQSELDGVAYMRPLAQLFEHSLEEKLLAARVQDGDPAQQALDQKRQQVDSDLGAVVATNARYAGELQTSALLSAVRDDWNVIQGAPVRPTSSLTPHVQPIADERALIAKVGDVPNLILDPVLNTYYLMYPSIVLLPEIQDRTEQSSSAARTSKASSSCPTRIVARC